MEIFVYLADLYVGRVESEVSRERYHGDVIALIPQCRTLKEVAVKVARRSAPIYGRAALVFSGLTKPSAGVQMPNCTFLRNAL